MTKVNNNELAFVGPLPPPLGGVAVMNRNAQRLMGDEYSVSVFNTSDGSDREDLYGGLGFKDFGYQLLLLIRYCGYIFRTSAFVVNVFTGSRAAFLRDWAFVLMAKVLRKKVIIHLHAKTEGELFVSGKMFFIFGKMLSFADKIIVLSEDHRIKFSRYVASSKLEVMQNFVFVDEFLPESPVRDSLEFLYVGRLSYQKGIYDVLNAIKLLKQKGFDLKLHFIGAAETDRADRQVSKFISDNELSACVVRHGLLEGDSKLELFKRCASLVFASHFENSPVVLKEGLAAKQIIVYSDILANERLMSEVPNKVAFPFVCGDSSSLATTMLEIIKNYDSLKNQVDNIQCPYEASDKYAKDLLTRLFSD